MQITFLGAAREVTGSCYLVDAGGHRFLVDYGLFQGGADAYRKNRAPLRFNPNEIEFVLLTHAHIDHSGLLPRLVALGFRGSIYATRATCDLLEVMLPDAAYVQEREAQRNRGRREIPALYTVDQAHAVLDLLRPVAYGEAIGLHPGLRCRFLDAGHILGSAIIELWATGHGHTRKVVFSGDIGQSARPIVKDPALIEAADVLIVESTYGNRRHKNLAATEEELVQVITDTLGRGGGNVIIPAFAVGRTQEILHVLADLAKRGRIQQGLQVYVDSPMATKATEVTLRHLDIIDPETRALISWGKSQRGERALHVNFTESVEESRRLNSIRHGAIIISASGMCDAGRIKYHLKYNLPRTESAIVFTGFQAAGTLGRRLVDGERHVKIFGDEVPVRARICTIGGLSAHADQADLMTWLRSYRQAPERTFVTHGEAAIALGFADLVRSSLGWSVDVPSAGDRFDFAPVLAPA